MTNILALPLVAMQVVTGTNEWWIDNIGFTEADGVTPLDLSGIDFRMMIKHLSDDATVYIDAKSYDADEWLQIGTGSGELGFLGIRVPVDKMAALAPQAYVGDVVAIADGCVRRVATIALDLQRGVTVPAT